ncbi:hypothetical protein STSV1pORF52 [Sulfolobus virus STSV1]|uniref:hypothetical protein n=1 Tax=Sulfolobus virus STSV1 TaxID=285013 RepID=UPI000042B122|nr:hypothetical protein STSV1pORF52 [Sulfolobus virus STSV1]CAH04235.1 hypothetical protein [Sulfolobus virus STSV1]
MTASPTPPPSTSHTVAPSSVSTSPQISIQAPSFFASLVDVLLIALVAILAIAFIVAIISRSRNKIPYLSVSHKNADAIVVLINSKLDELKVLPARYVRQGILHATENGALYLILVNPYARPYRFGVKDYNKPVYFAVGDIPMFSAFDFGTIAKLDVLRAATGKKTILDVIVDIITTNKEITGYIPIANNYAFAFTVDPKTVLTDEMLSFPVDATTAMTRALVAIGNDIREWSKMAQRIEKLRLMQSSQKWNFLLMLLVLGIIAFIMILVLANNHVISLHL